MSKKESSFLNMFLTLLIVTILASFALASVYNVTKEPIARSREAARQNAITQVVPAFDRLKTLKLLPMGGRDSLEFNLAYKGDDLVGVAVETYTDQGFGGRIQAMVGFYPDGRIVDVVHLQHAETPGLGDKIEKKKSDWSDQFKEFDPASQSLRVKKDEGDLDAITAATITSRAYCEGIQRAYSTFVEFMKNQEGGIQ